MSAPKLELVGIQKQFDGSSIAVDGIDLAVMSGETIALLGPSGCGKSTTLNMIVGLERPSAGDILIDGKSVVDLPMGKRNVGLVFQDYAVFTHMTVRQNLAFGLVVRKASKAEIAKAVSEAADLLDLRERLDAPTAELGGSELQRVAIGRTLVTKPAILLLDEPLSNLEAAARLAMRRELRRLQTEIGLTIVYVTHDQVEALSLADKIAVMNAGKIRQIAATRTICERPDHVFVAGFLGSPPMNLLRGKIAVENSSASFVRDDFSLNIEALDLDGQALAPGMQAVLGLRPDVLRIVDVGQAHFVGNVGLVETSGPETVVTVEGSSARLKVLVPSTERPAEGQTLGIAVDPSALLLFSGETGRRISA